MAGASVIRKEIFESTAFSAGGQAEPSAQTDLLAAGGLTPKLYALVTTKAPANCFGGLLGNTQLYRGPGLELAPLAGIFASSVPPDFRPLLRRPAGKAFDLQPGKTTLDPATKGTPVDSGALLGRSAPLSATNAAAASPGGMAAPVRLTIKLGGGGGKGAGEKKKVKKEKKEKKEKKRKREKS